MLTLWLSEVLIVFPDWGDDQRIRPWNPSFAKGPLSNQMRLGVIWL